MKSNLEKAKSIINTLQKKGFEAFIVGGAVRDHERGLIPKDIDIATNAVPEDIERLFKYTLSVGKHFGVIIVCINNEQFEVATFRKDLDYRDGRHPKGVIFSSAKEDVLRRDFTINGLFWHPISDKVIDYVNGRKDIKDKIIRAIGDPSKRFSEDKLRILRAIRFASNFNFEIENETWKAVCNPTFDLSQVSFERIRIEFEKILTRPGALTGLILLEKSKRINSVLPNFLLHSGSNIPEQTRKLFQLFISESLTLEEALFITLLGKECLFRFSSPQKTLVDLDKMLEIQKKNKEFMQQKTYSSQNISLTSDLIATIHTCLLQPHIPKSILRKIAAKNNFPSFKKILCKLNLLHHDLSKILDQLIQINNTYDKKDLLPLPLINGNALIKKGMQPSPQFSKILDHAYTFQLENDIEDCHFIWKEIEKIQPKYL